MSARSLCNFVLVSLFVAACGSVPSEILGNGDESPTPGFGHSGPREGRTTEPTATDPSIPTMDPNPAPETPAAATHKIVGEGMYHTLAASNSGFMVAWTFQAIDNWQLQTTDQMGQAVSPQGQKVLGSDNGGLVAGGWNQGYWLANAITGDDIVMDANGLITQRVGHGYMSHFATDGDAWTAVQDASPDPTEYSWVTVTLGGLAVGSPSIQDDIWWNGRSEIDRIALNGESVAIGHRTEGNDGIVDLRILVMKPRYQYYHIIELHRSYPYSAEQGSLFPSQGYPFVGKILPRSDGTFLVYWGVNHVNDAPERYLTAINNLGQELVTVEVPWMHDIALASDGRVVGVKTDHDSQTVELYRFAANLNAESVETVVELTDRKFYYLGIAQVAISGPRIAITFTTSPDSRWNGSQIEMMTLPL